VFAGKQEIHPCCSKSGQQFLWDALRDGKVTADWFKCCLEFSSLENVAHIHAIHACEKYWCSSSE